MQLFYSAIGRLRIIGFLEGFSLLSLIFIGIPLKYGFDYPDFTALIGAIHGGLFLLFLVSTLRVSIEENWPFKQTTWKIMLACLIPFGTFYIDKKILKPLYLKEL